MNWHLGTMGFSYDEWRHGVFYPAGMPARQYLGYYAQRFDAVEMDSTFYATPTADAVRRWREVTPPGFTICPKVPRHITHELRLHGAAEAMAHFLETMRLLEDNLGPVLLQFPPDFTFDSAGALVKFLQLLPADLRFAAEFRHRSWERPETAVLLQQHRLCWVAADYVHLSKTLHRTTDFLYLRFIGPHGQFATKDREQVDKTADLQAWYAQIRPELPHVTAVYAFFNNDYAGFSPATCNRFRRIVGLEPGEIRPLQQGRLF
ncbi:MAG: DUF72 domain-containing protein [Anaerolineales bacterium]|nr:DUF72 domain-containing protein [Anaerolineales bacterium]